MYIDTGAVDAGITGYDLWGESGLKLKELIDLDFGLCDLVLAGPKKYKNAGLKTGIRIGTCFPNLTANYLSRCGTPAQIIEVSGAVEILPRMGVSDLVVDLVSTGRTLRENNLIVLDKILSSTARLLCKKKKQRCVEFAEKLREVIK